MANEKDDDEFPMGSPPEMSWHSAPLIPKPAFDGKLGELFVTDAAGNMAKLGDVTEFDVQIHGGDLMKTVAAMMKASGLLSFPSAPDPSVADAFIFAFIGESMKRRIECPNHFSLVAELCNQFGHTRPLLEEFTLARSATAP